MWVNKDISANTRYGHAFLVQECRQAHQNNADMRIGKNWHKAAFIKDGSYAHGLLVNLQLPVLLVSMYCVLRFPWYWLGLLLDLSDPQFYLGLLLRTLPFADYLCMIPACFWPRFHFPSWSIGCVWPWFCFWLGFFISAVPALPTCLPA